MSVFEDVFVGSVLVEHEVSTTPFLLPVQSCICTSADSCLPLRLESSGYNPLSVTDSHDPVADSRAWRGGDVGRTHLGGTW